MSSELTNKNNDEITIKKELKKTLDLRTGIIENQNQATKYYFADNNGKKLQVIDIDGNQINNSFYSIIKIDDTHYQVCDFDYMNTLGVDELISQYDTELDENEMYNVKFHFGVVANTNGILRVVVPIAYSYIYKTNSNIIIVQSDSQYKLQYNKNGKPIEHTKIKKLGAICLDLNSNFYGFNIIPCIMDRLCDFDLEYKGFAQVGIDETTGYLSKEINIERYDKYLQLYYKLKSGEIDILQYFDNVKDAISKILYTKEEIIELEKRQKVKKIV